MDSYTGRECFHLIVSNKKFEKKAHFSVDEIKKAAKY